MESSMVINGFFVNIVLVVFLVVWLLLVIRGLSRGLIGMLLGVISWIFLIIFTSWLYPVLQGGIAGNDNLMKNIELTAERQVNRQEEKTGVDDWLESVTSASDAKSKELKDKGMILPKFMEHTYDETIDQGTNRISEGALTAYDSVHKALVSTFSGFLVKGLAILATIIVASVIVCILKNIIRLIGKLPVVHGISRFFGGVLGFIEGALLIWLIMYLANCLQGSTLGALITSEVEQSVFLSFLNSVNPFVTIFA